MALASTVSAASDKIPPTTGTALDMGITNKAFDSYEQGLIRDVIAARIPAKLDAGKLFA